MEEGITGKYYQWFDGEEAARRRARVLHPRLHPVDHHGEPGHAEAGPGRAGHLLAPDALPAGDQGSAEEPRLLLQRAVQEGPEHRPVRRVLAHVGRPPRAPCAHPPTSSS